MLGSGVARNRGGGVMEYWSDGVLGESAQLRITPSLQYSSTPVPCLTMVS